MTVDIHNHFYPAAYLQALRTGDYRASLTEDAGPDPVLAYSGDYNVLVPGHRDIAARLEDMDAVGMDTHVLSLTTPGVHIEGIEAGRELARAVNEDFSAISRDYPGRFYALAALPLQDPAAATEELTHSVEMLGLVGATLFTNVDGRTLDDPSYAPLYAAAESLGVPLFIHPTSPHDPGALADYRLVPLLGFLFDTTTAISRLIFGGILERHPGLKLIAAHLGGTLPYVAERLDRGYRVYPEISDLIPHPPSDYLARISYDTVSFDQGALRFVLGSMGADRLLLGSDYPHQIGDMSRALWAARSLGLPAPTAERILSGNARALLGI